VAMVSRREALKLGLITGSGLLMPRGARAQWGGGGASGSPPVTPFTRPLRVPPVIAPSSSDATTDYYAVTLRPAQLDLIPGKMATVWGYNGLYPGPTFKVRAGRRVVVAQTNQLPESISTHLHGGHTPPDSDGHPLDLVPPGGSKTYDYPNSQLPATLWYHDHAVDVTGRHVYMGLAGFYLITDAFEDGLPLPRGANDVPLVIQDRVFNADGSLNYPEDDNVIEKGVLGDRVLVNGVIQPYFQVARRKMRFRILNGSNARVYALSLSSGSPLVQVGSDGGLLSAPVSRNSVTIGPAERVDVVIDFAPYALGTSVVLKNQESSHGGWGGSGGWGDSPPGAISDLMRFDVVRNEPEDSSIPATLRTVSRIPPSSSVRARTFTLERDWINGRTLWTINGRLFDPARVDADPRIGTVETWRFSNRSGESHPMHMHDVMFQILDLDGRAPSAGDAGWKDTVLVPSWSDARVITRFADHYGAYVFHCHKLEHEDHAIMGQFEVRP
jgi:spore coat protein A